MSESFDTSILERAVASTRGVLANVTPDQLDRPTPCALWDVRAVVNHVVGATHFFTGAVRGDFQPSGDEPDFAAGDFVPSYDEGAAQAIAAFSAPGAAEKTVALPFGEIPVAAFMEIAATDTFTHGWDLARATGQPSDLDPALASQLYEHAKVALPDAVRGDEGAALFGARRDAPASAAPADQLAAFLGRTV
jgi:uncharacterized protein (TIGR03086 family)